MSELLNVEIKAYLHEAESVRHKLKEKNALFKGVDHQIDTYFESKQGRLKLREGNIESALIYYERQNQAGPKTSDILLYKSVDTAALKPILHKVLEPLVVVDKKREIYFVNNVKFHIDEVDGLGQFVEIEAIDATGEIGKEKLLAQCQYYMELFHIQEQDLLEVSYSDLMLAKMKAL
ncbi:MAG: class IV adenylate cyclase [Flammeovirgaceae bacterium]